MTGVVTIKKIFKQDKTLGLRAIIYIVIAILLMIADQQNHWFHKVREKANAVTLPIEYTVDWPIRFVESLVEDVETQSSLLKENQKLKAETQLLQSQVQKMLAIQSDNKQLRQLLESSAKAGGRVLQAQILAVSPDPFLHQFIIDKGTKQGVYQGQPVLDAYGVMGQVIQVGVLTSRVMLLTDNSSAIPVQDSRTGLRSIAEGDSDNSMMRLVNVTQTTSIKTGDLLITSGLGQRYPFGYPVGRVVSVEQKPGEHFLSILIQPTAHLNRSRLVLLVWPEITPIEHSIKKSLEKASKHREAS